MKKIMFNDKFGLTQAVLDGRKTQTRRIIPQTFMDKVEKFQVDYYNQTLDCLSIKEAICRYICLEELGRTPYQTGEIVAVAQSYKDLEFDLDALDRSPKDYKIVRGTLGQSKGWDNKMFVRADACKNRIRINYVRVEQLQDISYEDCLAEGVYVHDEDPMNPQAYLYTFPNSPMVYYHPREAYAALIDKISGKGTWESNPYVFVYDFELVKL